MTLLTLEVESFFVLLRLSTRFITSCDSQTISIRNSYECLYPFLWDPNSLRNFLQTKSFRRRELWCFPFSTLSPGLGSFHFQVFLELSESSMTWREDSNNEWVRREKRKEKRRERRGEEEEDEAVQVREWDLRGKKNPWKARRKPSLNLLFCAWSRGK